MRFSIFSVALVLTCISGLNTILLLSTTANNFYTGVPPMGLAFRSFWNTRYCRFWNLEWKKQVLEELSKLAKWIDDILVGGPSSLWTPPPCHMLCHSRFNCCAGPYHFGLGQQVIILWLAKTSLLLIQFRPIKLTILFMKLCQQS